MRKKIFILPLFFCALRLSAAGYEVADLYQNDWINFGFVGKPKSVVHLTGKPGKDLENFSDARFYSETDVNFNKNGYCSMIRFKDLPSEEVTFENVFSYHRQNGRRLMFSFYGREETEIFRKVFRYGANGKIVKEEITYPQKSSKPADEVLYRYDEAGKLIEKTTKEIRRGRTVSVETFGYNEAGVLIRKEAKSLTNKKNTAVWIYDDEGRQTSYEKRDGNGSEKTVFEYADGVLSQEIGYRNGKQIFRRVYHYENGVCTAELQSDAADRLVSIARLTYDSKGNWIRKVTYRFSEESKRIEVFQVEKRKITY